MQDRVETQVLHQEREGPDSAQERIQARAGVRGKRKVY